MGKLVSHVHVFDDRGDTHVFGPDDDVPEEFARKIGAHAFEDGEHPYLDDASDRESGAEPPRSGKGSGRKEWAAFAGEKGVEVEDGTSRDDIIALLADAGHIEA